jgi:hypothetical protein
MCRLYGRIQRRAHIWAEIRFKEKFKEKEVAINDTPGAKEKEQ